MKAIRSIYKIGFLRQSLLVDHWIFVVAIPLSDTVFVIEPVSLASTWKFSRTGANSTIPSFFQASGDVGGLQASTRRLFTAHLSGFAETKVMMKRHSGPCIPNWIQMFMYRNTEHCIGIISSNYEWKFLVIVPGH